MWVCVVRGWGGPGAWRGVGAESPPPSLVVLLLPVSLRTPSGPPSPYIGPGTAFNPHSIGQSRLSLVGTWSEEPVPGRRWTSGTSLGSLTQAFRGASQRGRVTVYPGPPRCRTGHAPRTKWATVKGVCDSCQWRVQVPDLGQTLSLATSEWEAEGGPECRLHS